MMRLALLLLPLLGRGLGGGCVLFAQNGVDVSWLAVNAGTVTFNVSWDKNDANMPSVWVDSVWVFVDYNKNGVMERLPVSGATATAGTVTKISGNDKGVWVAGNARTNDSFSAKVELFTEIKDVAGACAYASNYPPVGEYTSADKIEFTGTPGYDLVFVGGATTHTESNPYTVPDGYTIQSFTDKTGAPGIINCMPSATYNLTVSATAYCAGSSVTFALSNTTPGQTYRLYRGADAVGVMTGTGNPATFTGVLTGAGTYTAHAVAEKGYCAAVMTGVHTVSEIPLPSAATVTRVSAATVCQGTNVVFRASGTAGSTYTWLGTAGTVSGTGNGTLTVSGTATGTKSVSAYARLTSSGTTCQSGNAATVTAVVNPMPTITRSGGAASQSVYQNKAITAIVYTATNSATISRGGGFPAGVSGTATGSSFTISGTPSAAGTIGYTLTATVGGCTSAAAAGTITSVAVAAPSYAASTKTWIVGTQIWSDAIADPANCDKTSYSAPLPTTNDCRKSSYGYFFSWQRVINLANTYCPSPWRVPTKDDFCALDKTLCNRSDCSRREGSSDKTFYTSSKWGGTLGGQYLSDNTAIYVGTMGIWWSSTAVDATWAYVLTHGDVNVDGANSGSKQIARRLRCVR
jgi:uncharacterized protein (TIGR02145 family)